jgi:hypothetical protein
MGNQERTAKMPSEVEVHDAVREFKKLVPYYFGDERDYTVMRKVLEAAEKARRAAEEMRANR